jgi:hypothetical protein
LGFGASYSLDTNLSILCYFAWSLTVKSVWMSDHFKIELTVVIEPWLFLCSVTSRVLSPRRTLDAVPPLHVAVACWKLPVPQPSSFLLEILDTPFFESADLPLLVIMQRKVLNNLRRSQRQCVGHQVMRCAVRSTWQP